MQKLIIITLAILFTLTICGAVSAADNTTNNSTTTNISTGDSSNSSVNSSQNSSVQGSSKNETLPDPRIEHNGVIGNTVYTTIQAAIDAAQAGDTIWLESGTYATTTNYANPALVYITKSLTFKVFNGGTATINGSGTYRCVYVNSGVTATFYNITIANGKYYYGAGIFNKGTLNLNNCTLTGNTAITNPSNSYDSGYGGAIWNAATCNVYNCTFTGNTAIYGAAIENYDGITGSTTSSNTLTVSGSTFTGNIAAGTSGSIGGGVIDNWNGLSSISFNRIINNGLYDLYCIYGTLNAQYNWWGSNANPSARTSKLAGNLIVSKWLVLTVTASPTIIQNGETSTITADLLHDNGILSDPTHPELYYHDPAIGHVPDGISVTFGPISPSYGYYTTLTSTKTSNGRATATFQANDPNTPHTQSLTAAVDSQTSSVNLLIDIIPTVPDYSVITQEDSAVSGQVVGSDADGGTLTYTLGTGSSAPKHGTVSLNSITGAYTYTPSANYNGSDSFTVTVSDGYGGTATSTITVSISAVNDVPIAVDDTVTTDEDTSVSGSLTASDVDGDTLTYTLGTGSSAPQHGTVSLNSITGAYTYTPFANYNGSDSFTVTVSDGNGGFDTLTVYIHVTPVNDVPVAVGDTATTDEDTSVSGSVTGTDADGDALTYTKGTNPAHGTATVNDDGSYTYTPYSNWNGTDSFTVTVSDGNGGTATSTVTITVTPVNDVPVAVDDTATTYEDTGLASGDVTGNDIPSGDGGNVWSVVSGPDHGTLVMNADGTYTYTPYANYNGYDQFNYQIRDVDGSTSTATVGITINSVNDLPIAVDDYKTTNEDVQLLGNVAVNDIPSGDGGNVWSLVSGPAHTTTGYFILHDGGNYVYIPDHDYNGPDQFTYKVTDANGDISTATVFITVIPGNDAPTVGNYDVTTQEDTSTSGTVVGSDVDGDSLTYSVTNPSHGTITSFNPNTGAWTYMPGKDYGGDDSFEVTVSDGLATAVSKVTIHVAAVNDAPVANDDSQTIDEDTSVSGSVTAYDVDGDTLTYTLGTGSSAPQHGTVSLNSATGAYTYTPAADYNGDDQFDIIVSDGNGGFDTLTVYVHVNPVNDVPVAQNDNAGTDEDTSVSGSVSASDVDGDTLTYTIGTVPNNGVVSVSPNGMYTYTPNADWYGTDSFTVIVSDGKGGTATATVTITVNPVNDAPVAAGDSKATDEDNSVSGSVTGSDIDGDSLTYAKGIDPLHGAATVNADGTYTYTPNANWHGTDSFTVIVSDGKGGTDEVTVTIKVNPVNDNPAAVDDPATVDEDSSVYGNVSTNDTPSADGGNVWSKVTDPAHGTATVNADGYYTYTPDANYHGTDSFDYMITDVDGSTSTATVYITVNSVNDAPVANNESTTTKKDTAVNVDVLGNDSDVDGDSLTVTGVSDPAHGTAVINGDGTVSYTPDAGYYGLDQFSYTISDGKGGTSTGTVNITVNRSVSSVYVLTTVSKSGPAAGETITLTFKLGNNGPDTADGVVFTYVVPEGMEFVSLDSESGYPEPVYDPATRTVTWNLGNLPEIDPWLKVNLKVIKAGNFSINPAVTTQTYDPTLEDSIQGATLNAVDAADTSNDTSKTTVNAQTVTSKTTIKMKDTGLPLNYLILAILMVIGGLVPRRMK